jgi:hypothetical protein
MTSRDKRLKALNRMKRKVVKHKATKMKGIIIISLHTPNVKKLNIRSKPIRNLVRN